MKSIFSVIILSAFMLVAPPANAGDNSELEALKQEIENLKKDSYLTDTIRENELLKMSLKKLKSEVGELETLNNEIAGLKKALAQAEEKFSKEKAISTELSQAIVVERKTQYALKKELEKAQAERNVIQDQLAEISRDKKERDGKLLEFQKQIEDARSEQEAMKTQLKNISLENQNLKSNLDSLSKAQDNLKLSLAEAGKNSERLLKDIDTLKNENAALKADNQNIALKLKEKDILENRIAEINNEKKLQEEKLNDVQKLLADTKLEYIAMKQTLDTANESTLLTLQEKDKKINALNSLVADQEKKFQEKEALYQKLADDFKMAKITVTELWGANEKMKKEKEKADAEFASYEQKIAYLTEKLTELEKENKAKREELEKVKDALNRTRDILKGLDVK